MSDHTDSQASTAQPQAGPGWPWGPPNAAYPPPPGAFAGPPPWAGAWHPPHPPGWHGAPYPAHAPWWAYPAPPAVAPAATPPDPAVGPATHQHHAQHHDLLTGMVVGAAAAYLLSNETVQRTLIRAAVSVWSTVQGGLEEVKERFRDAEAEIAAATTADGGAGEQPK